MPIWLIGYVLFFFFLTCKLGIKVDALNGNKRVNRDLLQNRAINNASIIELQKKRGKKKRRGGGGKQKRFFLKYCELFYIIFNFTPFSSEEHVASQEKVTSMEDVDCTDVLPTRSRFLLARRSQLHFTVTTTTTVRIWNMASVNILL